MSEFTAYATVVAPSTREAATPRLTQSEIRRAIFLTSWPRGGGYTVRHDIAGEAVVCEVPTTEIGNTIVRALRDRATRLYGTRRSREAA